MPGCSFLHFRCSFYRKSLPRVRSDPERTEFRAIAHSPGMDERNSNSDDNILMQAEELADSIGISRAFVQLATDLGCPVQEGRLTRDMLFQWLHDNSDQLRRIAGLPDIPPISDCTIGKHGELQEIRAILTMLDFMHARACTPDTRELCEQLSVQLFDPR